MNYGTIPELIQSSWEHMEVYHLTEEQKEALLNSKELIKEHMMINKGTVWEEHMHSRPQLLLVIVGRLTHVVRGKEIHQEANDLLVVPKNVLHRAYSGKSKPLLLYVFHKK
jgi:mannose-6-phosphate isomerase-like protein (cupin superfamily)